MKLDNGKMEIHSSILLLYELKFFHNKKKKKKNGGGKKLPLLGKLYMDPCS